MNVDGRGHTGFEHHFGEHEVVLLRGDLDVRPVIGLGLAVGPLLGQRVGADVGQLALQHAVDRVVKGIELDLYRQSELELADVHWVDARLDHHVAFSG